MGIQPIYIGKGDYQNMPLSKIPLLHKQTINMHDNKPQLTHDKLMGPPKWATQLNNGIYHQNAWAMLQLTSPSCQPMHACIQHIHLIAIQQLIIAILEITFKNIK